jgi:hypothetical protein
MSLISSILPLQAIDFDPGAAAITRRLSPRFAIRF